jgi:hypothetical protein
MACAGRGAKTVAVANAVAAVKEISNRPRIAFLPLTGSSPGFNKLKPQGTQGEGGGAKPSETLKAMSGYRRSSTRYRFTATLSSRIRIRAGMRRKGNLANWCQQVNPPRCPKPVTSSSGETSAASARVLMRIGFVRVSRHKLFCKPAKQKHQHRQKQPGSACKAQKESKKKFRNLSALIELPTH